LRLQKTRYLLFSFPMSRPCAFFPGASGDFMLYRGPMPGGAGTHCAGAFFFDPKVPRCVMKSVRTFIWVNYNDLTATSLE
jgi:hypothetical protein